MKRLVIDAEHIAIVVQPPDEGGEGDAWVDLLRDGHVFDEAVRKAGLARRMFGLHKHGRVLALTGGTRDPDIDLVQELLDAAVYAWRGGRRDTAGRLLHELAHVLREMNHAAILRATDQP